jgi:hypothetical protein
MQGQINTTFGRYQADLFESGLVAEIGPSAFSVWCAIKSHSNFNSGISWPSIRRLMLLTGLASATVQTAIARLSSAHLLRSTVKGKRRFYVARERLDVRLGERTLCSIVIDYVPTSLRKRLDQIKGALEEGKSDHAAFADVEIIPGRGFTWDSKANVLRAAIPAVEVPQVADPLSDEALSPLALRVKQIEQMFKQKRDMLPKK